MGKLSGKKLILLGERDGVAGPAMEESLKNCGAEVAFSVTECFV
jgi:betaine reductase